MMTPARTLARFSAPFFWMIAVLLALSVVSVSAQEASSADEGGQVRFMHAIPEAAPIDVRINGQLALTDLAFGEVSTYLNVPSGDHRVTVTPVGFTTAIWEQDLSVTPGDAATLIASSTAADRFEVYGDNLVPTPESVGRLLLVHAIDGGPTVDVTLAEDVLLNGALQPAGTVIATGMNDGDSFGTFDLPAQIYRVNVGPADGAPILTDVALPITAQTSVMAVVYGTPDAPRIRLLTAATEASADRSFVRFAHTLPGGPDVALNLNERPIVPLLSFGEATPHLPLPSGEQTIQVINADDESEVFSQTLTIPASGAITVIVTSGDEGPRLSSFTDTIGDLSPESARATLINAIPDARVSVSLDDGPPLAAEVVFDAMSTLTDFAPVQSALSANIALGDESGDINMPETTFYGGVYYNLIAIPGSALASPQVMVFPTSLTQSLVSAPGASTADVVQAEPTESAEDADTPPLVTPVPTIAPEPTAVAQPTVAPPQPTQPPVANQTDLPTAEINLNPDANLHLRQLPSADALSLGLAPANATLIVEGREGAPVALVEGNPPPPEAEDFEDPAAGLGPDEDLNPADTWLNVIYQTPDGGRVEAWVNALYLEVFNADGERLRLADLPTVGRNIPGERVNTAVAAPTPQQDEVTAFVTNLNPGVRLNVRRNPDVNSEVLTRLENGTELNFVGVDNSGEWTFVENELADGGIISGWVSSLYVDLRLNGEPVTLGDLQEREREENDGLFQIVPLDRRGEIRGEVEAVAVPTQDPFEDEFVAEVELNPDANLQFRRNPDASSESLGLIPSGERLVVTGRTADGQWLQTTYEGQTGWIASAFVALTFNERFVDVVDVPIAE